MVVREGVALTEEGVEPGGVWGVAEENKDWASRHDYNRISTFSIVTVQYTILLSFAIFVFSSALFNHVRMRTKS